MRLFYGYACRKFDEVATVTLPPHWATLAYTILAYYALHISSLFVNKYVLRT